MIRTAKCYDLCSGSFISIQDLGLLYNGHVTYYNGHVTYYNGHVTYYNGHVLSDQSELEAQSWRQQQAARQQ